MNNIERVAWAICKQANYSFTEDKQREEFERYRLYYTDQANAAIEAIAENNVLAVRGIHDAPGFDACVNSEADSLKRKSVAQPTKHPTLSPETLRQVEELIFQTEEYLRPDVNLDSEGKRFARYNLRRIKEALAALGPAIDEREKKS